MKGASWTQTSYLMRYLCTHTFTPTKSSVKSFVTIIIQLHGRVAAAAAVANFLMGASPRWSSQHNTMSISISNSIISVQRFRKQQSSFLSDPTTTCHMLCAAKVEQHEQRTGRSSLSLPSTCLHLPTSPPSSSSHDLVHKN